MIVGSGSYNNYLKSETIYLCYLCNSKESRVRKYYNIINALNIQEMTILFRDYDERVKLK